VPKALIDVLVLVHTMTSLNQHEIETTIQKASNLLLKYGDKTPCYIEIGIGNTHSLILRRIECQQNPEWRIINYDSYESVHSQFTRGYMHIFIPKTF
jgi:hypothetical protein